MSEMKNYNYIACILFLCVLMAACKKNFLDRAPGDFISETQVFQNINNAEDYLNNAYTNLPNWYYGSGDSYVTSAMTDEGKQVWLGGAFIFNFGSWNPSEFFPLQNDWTSSYQQIRRCNVFLENFNLIPEDPMNASRKNRLKGEAFALRAFYHFILFRGWGKIPLVDKALSPATDGEAVFLKRSPLNEVVDFISRDLDSADKYLPAKYDDGALWGRVTKDVNLAIRSRMYLFYASPLFNPGNDASRWEKAATASKAALNAALADGYVLLNDYTSVFNVYANKETVWGRFMGNGLGGNGIDQVLQGAGYGGWDNSGPTQSMVDAYEMQATGLGVKETGSGYDPKHPYAGRDPRFYASILYPNALWKGRRVSIYGQDKYADANKPGTNYWWKKFHSESTNLFNGTGGVNKTYPIFRIGEIILNCAEAVNEANGPTEAYTFINQIRKRANMPDLKPGLSKEAMREAIRHERRVEMALEGHRFWDVRRWKIAEIVDNGPVYGVNYTISGTDTTYSYFVSQNRVFDPKKHYWLPVPQDEMDKLNGKNPEFTQTEGW